MCGFSERLSWLVDFCVCLFFFTGSFSFSSPLLFSSTSRNSQRHLGNYTNRCGHLNCLMHSIMNCRVKFQPTVWRFFQIALPHQFIGWTYEHHSIG